MAGVHIKDLTIKDGKLANVVIEGDAKGLVEMAAQNVEKAKAGTKHMQRPLERKFNSIISKLHILYDDLAKHDEYVQDMNDRKWERHQDAELNRFTKSSKNQAAMARFLGGDL